ncbi:MAG: 6-carboxytetrahydropterin synthase [Actinomycetota bacterium]
MRTLVTRREHFSAGHRLYNPGYSDERNAEVFGKCANPSGHGHNYVLEVTLEGSVDPETGFLFDLKELSHIIHKSILDEVDHRNLNEDVEWLRGRNPTTETLAQAFWERLEPQLPAGLLSRVRLIETDKNWVDCTRD